mgnify:CR=1 FL=1|tara:strand:- start:642 stop:2840 length:2199 start_codon:yes stop_codon:yes gene_type:complete
MIKKIIKIVLIIFLILTLIIFYLSIFGIKTDKFNNQITNSILKINKKINLSLSDVSYLLNPYDFTINIKTKNPKILLEGRSFGIKTIQTNIALKSLINDQFLIDDLQIITKEIKLSNIITLARVFKNSQQLFILGTFIKDGIVTASMNFNFDDKGEIKKNYKIKGTVKKVKLNILNQFKLQDLNFNFNISKNIYSLKKLDTKFNGIKLIAPQIEIKKNKNSFFVDGQLLTKKKNFDIKELKSIFVNFLNEVDIQKIEFSSKNNFSFNINKNLKFDSLKIESVVDLEQLIVKKKDFQLKQYLPSFVKEIKLEKHNIIINYNKKKFDIKGNGNFLLEDKSDEISYHIIKNKNDLSFDSKMNLKNNSLLINFLDYEKKEGLNSLVSIKGNFKKNNQLSFDLINIKEKNNGIVIKGLELSKSFKILDITNLNINYRNNNNILNNLSLKKNNSNFIIEGESFDASRIINNIMDNDEESSSIFDNLNARIDVKIKKTYIDEINYLNDLYGKVKYDNNKIKKLKLNSIFPNEKKINLSIETKNDSEIVTRLFTDYPKPLIKRYDFIKGFEEGYLDFYSSKKKGVSNSVLIIDNFKVKEVPVFAKLLSLASLQGIADLLTGEGIRFTDLEMNFSSQRGLTTIDEMYAIGPAVSVLMDGYIETKKLVSLRGTLVPATTINRSIASIPLLGKILIGDKTGEGVFGVSFKIKGPPKDLKTTVNPIKSLTPRFITRTIEKIKKN